MKQLFSKFLVAFLLTSAVVLSWSEYFLRTFSLRIFDLGLLIDRVSVFLQYLLIQLLLTYLPSFEGSTKWCYGILFALFWVIGTLLLKHPMKGKHFRKAFEVAKRKGKVS